GISRLRPAAGAPLAAAALAGETPVGSSLAEGRRHVPWRRRLRGLEDRAAHGRAHRGHGSPAPLPAHLRLARSLAPFAPWDTQVNDETPKRKKRKHRPSVAAGLWIIKRVERFLMRFSEVP